jgi:uncharacterized lipoprotein YddW (UPF0748 family)
MVHIRKYYLFLPILFALVSTPLSTSAQSTSNLARGLSAAIGAQGRVIWIDGTANIFRSVTQNGVKVLINNTTSIEGVAAIVSRCKAAHINTIVVDVKPLSGQVLYASKIAPRMTTWQTHPVPSFDVLAAFIAEGHKAGLQVDACINVLSEGHKYYSVGPAYTHEDWQSVVYCVDRGLNSPSGARLSVRVANEPADPNVPELLRDDSAVLGSEPSSGMVGLESIDTLDTMDVQGDFGKQTNVVLDADNRVTGVVDSALLGDDPLIAPESGHMVTATRPANRDWISKNIKVGDHQRFDLHIERTPIAKAPSEKIACFVNPLCPDVRKYELDMVREITSNYAIDGLVLDRCRYSNLYNDFSDRTRDAFGQWLTQHPPPREPHKRAVPPVVNRFPEDIFSFAANPGDPIVYGPLFKSWLEFRAHTITDFVCDVAKCVRSIKPKIALGTYVGSWYPKYYEVGVNWGSERTPLHYSWFTPDYPKTGYAEYFDWVCTGCYYKVATRDDARADGQNEYSTVEYAAQLSNLAVASGAFVYGGIYVLDYPGKPDVFMKALDAAARQTQGWMIFDISQLDDANWWPLLEKVYPTTTAAPDQVPDLLESIRSAR